MKNKLNKLFEMKMLQATNNTWTSGGAHSRQGSQTVTMPTGEAVLIEDDTTDAVGRPMLVFLS